MQTQVRFIADGANALIGAFNSGDTARVGRDFAQHLVDVGVAVYADAPAPVAEPQVTAEPAPVVRTNKRGR